MNTTPIFNGRVLRGDAKFIHIVTVDTQRFDGVWKATKEGKKKMLSYSTKVN